MLSGYQTEEELIQNMADAGCKEEMAADVLNCLKQGQKKKGLMLLQRQRKALLDGIHKDQFCIEYLDGVMDGMRKGNARQNIAATESQGFSTESDSTGQAEVSGSMETKVSNRRLQAADC